MRLIFLASFFRLLLALFAGSIILLPTHAATITLDIDPVSAPVAAGNTASFVGSITNRTGGTLESTDLFLNFGAFDFNVLTPTQVLGGAPFSLADFTFISNIDLFTVEVSAAAPAGIYGLQVFLSDITGNISDSTDLFLTVSAVPEPSAAVMGIVGLAFLILSLRLRRSSAQVPLRSIDALL